MILVAKKYILFSCAVEKGEQCYIQEGVIPRRVKFLPTKEEHIKWMRTVTRLVDFWQPARRLFPV